MLGLSCLRTGTVRRLWPRQSTKWDQSSISIIVSKEYLARYVVDMDKVIAEISRVLKKGGEAVLVVGDSTIRNTFVQNSRCLVFLGERKGLKLQSMRRRSLPDNRRYLPPPGREVSGKQLRARMRKEVVLVFSKQ